jgi:Cu(I)/Ag(I) efflux system membrane fusion protein
LVDNPENKLKLEMFVNVAIKYDLGDKLAVPEEAVMHAGTRDIVFVAGANGHFEPRVVTLGSKAQGYYEVLRGLSENDRFGEQTERKFQQGSGTKQVKASVLR